MKKNFKAYKCYSNNLKEFLLNKGVEYLAVAIDPKTNKTFWLFLKDNELDGALTEWTKSKPSI